MVVRGMDVASVSRAASPTPTTSSLSNLVEGMSCESPYQKVIVDSRDSQFSMLHDPVVEKRKEHVVWCSAW